MFHHILSKMLSIPATLHRAIGLERKWRYGCYLLFRAVVPRRWGGSGGGAKGFTKHLRELFCFCFSQNVL